jgi:isocitrate dehydrogenase
MITIRPDMTLDVPDNPVMPFLERGRMLLDIWRSSVRVFDTESQKAYGGKQEILGRELPTEEKSFHQTGKRLPEDTRTSFREYCHRTHGRSDGYQQQGTNKQGGIAHRENHRGGGR